MVSGLAIITGASSGLGLALARTTPFPARTIDISRSGPPEGEDIEHLAADLSRPEDWLRVGEHISNLVADDRFRRIVFIHAAGTLTPIGFAGEVDTGDYVDNVVLNSASGQVLGHLFLKAVFGGNASVDLVMISSGAASSVYPGWSAYGAGKAALDQWVRNVGAEQKERGGARVSAIAPGVIATAMQEEIRETSESDFPDVDRFRELYSEGELVEPETAARRVWAAIEAGIESGSVIDARDFT
ncbi:MAG: SDR family NAD(P)-dependent oxidoreductase [Acidimicrobiia bacterium]|jgi:NAD(P)-dependent dehydrogenase (short-subunit alcohol dehydrogenase family)